MERLELKSLLLSAVLLFCAAGVAFGEDPNVKWIQYPDLNYTGIDVDASVDVMDMAEWPDHILADDFNCTSTEPITDIHIWSSWYHDELPDGDPNNVFFVLAIRDDLPVGDPCNPYSYSIPGKILWERIFGSDKFEVAVEAAGIAEGYYVPGEDFFDPDGDWTCWRYDFYIDPCEAFYQKGTIDDPCVYWLSVHAGTNSEFSSARFGWKTSLDHWNDDAVFFVPSPNEPDPNWQELRYPQWHIFEGNSIDLAFSITTGQEPNEPNEPEPVEPNCTKPLMPHTKWSQPPIETDPSLDKPNYCGWGEDSSNIDTWRIVADDFRCLGTMPITSVHWWGSYYDWEGNEPPPVSPDAWQIGFWSNIADPTPFDPYTFSHPNELLWQIEVEANQTDVNLLGEPSLISYWRFNENAGVDVNDSANGNHGKIYPKYNVNSMWTIGKEGSALYFHGGGQFDSSADEVRVPHSASLDITGPFTVEAWIKANGTEKYDAIVDKYNGSPTLEYGFTLYLTDGNLRLSLYGGAAGDKDASVLGIDLRDNQWHHVAGLWDGTNIKLYIDGTPRATASWGPGSGPASTTHDLGIGKRLYGWGGYLPFEGTIDEVAIYNTNLTDDKIKQHYEGGLASYVDVEKCGNLFQYSLYMEPNDYFWQDDYNDVTEDSTFWVSIMAVYPNDVNVDYLWGWITRPWHWMDDAVIFSHDPCTGPLVPGATLDPCSIEPIKDPVYEESYDMAFELDTNPNYIKWEQLYTGLRNWPHYEDVNSTSNIFDPSNDRLVADDWRCLKRTPITAIVWWGSYIDYDYEACTGPIIRPIQPNKFLLKIWTDVPAGADPCYTYSHPNEPIWEYETSEYDEVLVGYDKHPHGAPDEPVFRYSVRLPEDEWFKQHNFNEVFWLSVQAIYDINQPNYLWGWTNHEHVFNDDAVSGYYDDGNEVWIWTELYDQTSESEDMSFMLFTDPGECVNCPDYNIDSIVNNLDLNVFTNNWLWTGSAGGFNNGDLNCDGAVKFDDFAILAQVWLESCP